MYSSSSSRARSCGGGPGGLVGETGDISPGRIHPYKEDLLALGAGAGEAGVGGPVHASPQGKGPAPAATGVPTMSTPSASGARKIADLNGFAIPQLGGCLTKIAAGRKVLLADVARYLGTPAAIIILQSPTASAYDVVVVGLACSSSGSDIIAKSEVAALPAG